MIFGCIEYNVLSIGYCFVILDDEEELMSDMPVPLYQQIKSDLKSAIERGTYKPNDKIPTEPELSAEYSVSRITVRRAVEELCNEGYLVKFQGRGTFVNSPRIHRKIRGGNQIESFTKTCQEAGVQPGARVLDCKIVPVREDEREFFGGSEEDLLLYVKRIRTADGRPIFQENLFLPYPEFKDLLQADWRDISAFALIHTHSGRLPEDTSLRTIEVTRASMEQAQELSVPLGAPLFFVNAYFVDQQGRPIVIGRHYYVGSRYMFEV